MSVSEKISKQLVLDAQQKSAVPSKIISVLKAFILPCIFIFLCEILVRNGTIEPYLLPAPSSLLQSFIELLEGDLWQHIWASSWRVFLGFTIGSGLGLIFAILVGLNKQAEAFCDWCILSNLYQYRCRDSGR